MGFFSTVPEALTSFFEQKALTGYFCATIQHTMG